MTIHRLRLSGLAFMTMIGLSVAGPAVAAPFTQLFVFGDSLSDVDNNGRYSDRYLWDEHLAGVLYGALRGHWHGNECIADRGCWDRMAFGRRDRAWRGNA